MASIENWWERTRARVKRFAETWPWTFDAILCLALATAYFGVAWRYRLIDPRHLDWIFNIQHDLAQYLVAISFYRFADWSFPITRMDTMFYPLGTSVTQADGIPLLAVPYKLLDPWLPPILQYFGIWLFACVFLQTLFAKRILALLGASKPAQWAGAVFVMTSVQLAFATEHAALWGHWLILAAFYLLILPSFPFRRLCGLVVLAQWVHAYLFLMVLFFASVTFLKHWRTPRNWWPRAPIFVACVALSSWVVGYFDFIGAGHFSFRGYQADLTAFFNSGGASSIIPKLHFDELGWGGFTYLGLGGLIGLGALLFKPAIRGWKATVHEPWLLAACLVLAAWGFSTEGRVFGKVVYTLPYLDEWLSPFEHHTRAIGRFVWPLYYYLLIFGVRALDTVVPPRRGAAVALATGLVLLQAADIGPWLYSQGRREDLWKKAELPAVSQDVAERVTGKTEILMFMPPITRWPCRGTKRWGTYWQYGLFAATHRLKTNSEFRAEARPTPRKFESVCRFTRKMWNQREKHPEMVFIRQGE